MRQTAQRYVPPSRRAEGRTSNDAVTERRELEGVVPFSQVKLVVLQQKNLDFEQASCPLDIEAQLGSSCPADNSSASQSPGPATVGSLPAAAAHSAPAAPSTFLIFFPERLPTELLCWLGDTFPEGAARLEFPPTLSKQERARWHHAAERAHLHGESVGLGDGRYLTISTASPISAQRQQDDGGGGSGGSEGRRRGLTREQIERARFIWDCCQLEGGKHWERSQGEVEAMVASGQPLPEDVEALVDKRVRGEEVHRLLRGGQPSEALSLLSEDPRLAWVKDATTGGYPIHQAAWKGYESVLLFLSSLPGVLEQRDGRRDTALAVAIRRRHVNIEQLLLDAGAKPEHASFSQEAAPPAAEAYCSWSAEERRQYRQGGSSRGAPPPGLHLRGRGGRGPGGGRGVPSGVRGAQVPAETFQQRQSHRQEEEQQQQPRCPW